MNTFLRGMVFIGVIVLVVFVPNLFDSGEHVSFGVVGRIIDGDTLEMENGDTIRLLGINTPEKNERGYEEAKEFLRFYEGKEVKLVWTVEEVDKYYRNLRYLFYNENFINAEILRNGLGSEYIFEKDKYTEELIKAEKFAMKKGFGVWEKSKEKCAGCISFEFDDKIVLENNCRFDCSLRKWLVKEEGRDKVVLDFELGVGEIRKVDWEDGSERLFLRDGEEMFVEMIDI